LTNIYLDNSYQKEVTTDIIEKRTIKKKTSIVLQDNIFYPGGGGQPFDKGIIEIDSNKKFQVTKVIKLDGKIYICFDENFDFKLFSKVTAYLDWNRRYKYMRCHTAAHALMGALRVNILNYSPNGIEISEDGSNILIKFFGDWDGTKMSLEKLIKLANNIIQNKSTVFSEKFSSLSDAINKFKEIYRGPQNLEGQVRVIVINEWDANPCGGTHVENIIEVGNIKLLSYDKNILKVTIVPE
jgi:alanyl-tRNA synthetase